MLFIIHVYPIMCLCGLMNKLVATQLLKSRLKLTAVNQCQPFEPHEPHVIFIEYDMYLRLLYFSIIWIKILDGYHIARVWRN